jgi:hypothetical protein
VAEFKGLDLNALVNNLKALMPESAGLVAGRLGTLRRPDDPHGLAAKIYRSGRCTLTKFRFK